jgi:hypothetical protein
MKTLLLAACLLSIFTLNNLKAQHFDHSSGMEFIFGGAQTANDDGTETPNQAVRFTAFLHIQQQIYYKLTKSFGLYSGIAIRNVGFIEKEGDYTYKYRTYTAGIPLALTFGNLEKHFFIYGGAEAGMAFNYKEKRFNGSTKEHKSTSWFSGKTNTWQPQLFAGIQFPYGANVKFAYYPENFFNKDYAEEVNGESKKLYENKSVNLYYVSISFQLFASDAKKITGGTTPENRTAYR